MKIRFKKSLFRPILYKIFTYGIIALALAGLWNRFVNRNGLYPSVLFPSSACTVIFGAGAWFSFLRLDRVPMMRGRAKHRQQNRMRSQGGGMLDALNAEPESFEELTEEEKNLCSFASCLILCLFSGVTASVAAIL